MTNIVDKVIKLCDKICNGNYPFQKLYVYGLGGFGISTMNFNLSNIDDNKILHISTSLGVSKDIIINRIEECKLTVAFEQVKEYAESLVENILDDCLNVENIKISNVNELDCNN